jgi:CMP-N,N'-diacetyllegionaminic acid synthase
VIDGKNILAVILARGGSKRLPGKNILDLAGKPLIAWSIESGLNSKYIDEVIVSSDSDKILNISKKYGTKIVKRPSALASDTATSFDAIKHTIDIRDQKFDFVILLQPTSPLRNNGHIDEALELLIKKNADAIISVTETDYSPSWADTLPKDRSMVNFLKNGVLNKRSQDFVKHYRINGAIYICRTEKLLEEKSFFLKGNIYAYQMNRESSVDIDEKIDFQLANLIIENIIV